MPRNDWVGSFFRWNCGRWAFDRWPSGASHLCGRESHAHRTLFLYGSTADGQERKQQGPCGNPLTVEGFANTAPTKQGKRKAALRERLIEIDEMRCGDVRSLKPRSVLGRTRAGQGIDRGKCLKSVHVQHIPCIADRLKQKSAIMLRRPHTAAIPGIRDGAPDLGGSDRQSDSGRKSRQRPPTDLEISGNHR